MGPNAAPRQGEGAFRPIVAFDFDGTLTCQDSFHAFLGWRSSPARWAAGMVRLAPAGLGYMKDRNRGRLKAAAIREFLAGLSRAELEGEAQRFAAQMSRRLLRPDAAQRWKHWRTQGARLVIVTASPETLVAPFARGLGADALIATRLVFDAEDRVTGALDGANCRGPEKVVRLRQVFGPDVRLEAAYGDSDGDREMLKLADEAGMKVFGARP